MAQEGSGEEMKIRNHCMYNEDRSELQRLAEEYQMTGRDTKLEPGKLIIFALPRRKNKNENARKAR